MTTYFKPPSTVAPKPAKPTPPKQSAVVKPTAPVAVDRSVGVVGGAQGWLEVLQLQF